MLRSITYIQLGDGNKVQIGRRSLKDLGLKVASQLRYLAHALIDARLCKPNVSN